MQPSSAVIDTTAWKKRWLGKLADRSRPSTPQPQQARVYTDDPLDPFLYGKNPKLTVLFYEGIYERSRQCPGCQTAEHVIDDHKEGCSVCTGCGLVLRERILSDAPEVEWDATKDKDDTMHAVLRQADSDRAARPWEAGLETFIMQNGGLRAGQGGLARAQTSMQSRNADLDELLRKHSEAYDRERLDMLAERTLELSTWSAAMGLDKAGVQAKIEELQRSLKVFNSGPDPAKSYTELVAKQSKLLQFWQQISKQTPFEIESRVKSLGHSVQFLTTSHLKSAMSEEDKQKLHEELTLRRFGSIAENMHRVAVSLRSSVPVQLISVAQEYLKRFVSQHDRRLNSRSTWSCCCLQLAAMHEFGFMFNERELRMHCSQPCMMKTLHKDMRVVRKALQLPQLPPAKLVQLHRTYLQAPFSGSGSSMLGGDLPLTYKEITRLDMLFSVVLELLYAVVMPKPEPFKPRPKPETKDDDAAVLSESDSESDGDNEDDLSNESAQQLARQTGVLKSLQGLSGSKRGRSSSGESASTADKPADKKHMPALRAVSHKQQDQTDSDAVQSFIRPAVVMAEAARTGKQEVKTGAAGALVLSEVAAGWPDSIKKDTIAALQRRSPRTIAAALFYLGVQAMRSASVRFTVETVRRVAFVGAIPLRESKAQLLYFMAFIRKEPRVDELLHAALVPYLSSLNNTSSSSSMDTSSSSSSNNAKPDAEAAFMLCP